MPRWQFPLIGAALASLMLLVFITMAELTGPRPPEGREVLPSPLSEKDGALHVAGTGTWLPLARALAEAFQERRPETEVVVHESIGSGGGLRAITDGVIDVGLLSSPEGALRRVTGCRVVPIVTGAVVFAVHPSVPIDGLTHEQVLAIFEGRMTRWPDGELVVPLLREHGDSATRVASSHIPGLESAMETARVQGRWPIFLTDGDIARALEDTPGGVGLHDLGSLRLEHPRVRALTFDGLRPGIETLSDHSYPLRRTLALVLPNQGRPEAHAFLAFVLSDEGREVMAQTDGYVPVTSEEP